MSWGLLDEVDLVVGQPVKAVDFPVKGGVGGFDLTGEGGLFVGGGIGGQETGDRGRGKVEFRMPNFERAGGSWEQGARSGEEERMKDEG